MKRILGGLWLAVAVAQTVSADIVYLHSGEEVHGTIVDGSAEQLVVEVDGARVEYPMREVKRYAYEPKGAWTPTPPPPEEPQTFPEYAPADAATAQAVSEAYLASNRAIHSAETLEDILAVATRANRANITQQQPMSDEEVQQRLSSMKAFSPPAPRVGEVLVNGDAAVVNATGEMSIGPVRGTVRMIREEGRWLVESERWTPAE